MKAATLRQIRYNKQLKKRLAKLMALQCFRNTELENLHAGIVPSSKTGDCSDVKVVTSFGEIPWNEVSRLSDEEMKKLMIDVVNHCYDFLILLFDDSRGDDIIEVLRKTDLKKEWQDPTGTLWDEHVV